MSDRRRRRPAVESLEARALLAAPTSPSSPVPVHPEPVSKPTPQQVGAAYREVVAIQSGTLRAISAAHRQLYAAYDELAARANPNIGRDRIIRQQAADLTLREEQGLMAARGVAELDAYTDKLYIPLGLYTSLPSFVKQDQATGANLDRSARRSVDAAVRELDALRVQLVSSTSSST